MVIEAGEDLQDIGQLVIRGIPPEQVPPGGTLWLQTSNPYVVRVFTGAAPGHMAFMGPNMLTEQDIGISATDRTFGLEGVFPGTTVFTLKLRDATDAVICQDSVTVTVVQLWVFWETTGGQQILEANNHPTAGIGVKYMPDATVPGGGWNDMVQVRVLTDAPVAGACPARAAVSCSPARSASPTPG